MPSKNPKQNPIDDATREAAWDELIRMKIRGSSHRECGEKLGFHVKTIEKWCANKEFQLKLKRTRALVFTKTEELPDAVMAGVHRKVSVEIEQLIEQYSQDAIVKIRNLMEKSKSEGTQLKAAVDLADRGKRTSKVHKVETAGSMMIFTPELLAAAAATAMEIKENREIGRVIEPLQLDTSMIPEEELE